MTIATLLPPITSASVAGRSVQAVPSGQPVELVEVLIDQVGSEAWLRFRFLTPQIGNAASGVKFEQVQTDFQYLCDAVALPYMVEYDLQADTVVIALMDKVVDFGSSDPDVTQMIEAFAVQDGRCVAEGVW